MMEQTEVKEFIKEVMLEMRGQGPCEFCESPERRVQHRQEHEFIRGLMKIADRWDNVRWGILREVLKGLTFILITAIIIGLIIMANNYVSINPQK